MNFEQTITLPINREDFLVNNFAAKKLVYAEGLGLLGYQLCEGKVYPPRPGTTEPFIGEPYSTVMFIYAPTEQVFLSKVKIEGALEIVRFDFREVLATYKPNTGLTWAKDKNGLMTLLLNYRKESDGSEKITLHGLNEKFLEKAIKPLPAFCTVTVDDNSHVVKVAAI